jgi:hypothetical protein
MNPKLVEYFDLVTYKKLLDQTIKITGIKEDEFNVLCPTQPKSHRQVIFFLNCDV